MKHPFIFPLFLTAFAVSTNAQTPAPSHDPICKVESDGREVCITGVEVRRRGARDSLFRRTLRYDDSTMMKRAALGLELRATGTRRDTLGVFVAAVTPQGPAEAAGIYEGDRIASINGVDLRTPAADVEDDYTNGMASHRLTREVRKLAPGGRVNLRIFSQGRYRDVSVTAGRASDLMRNAMRIRIPRGGQHFEFHGPGAMQLRESFPRMPTFRRTAPSRMKTMQPGAAPTFKRTLPGVTLMDADEVIELEDIDAPMILDGEFEEVEVEEKEDGATPEPIRKIVQQAERAAEAALRSIGST